MNKKEITGLTLDERQLIDFYRKADERGKHNILRVAEAESMESEIIYFEDQINNKL